MRYVDVCAGISAITQATREIGWEAAVYAEIDKHPRALLTHRYPGTPLVGDFTQIRGDEYGPVDLLNGGTPCQDFSVAGIRAGLGGDRGNLTLEYARLAYRARPRWFLLENVPGIFSIDAGRGFGAIIAALAGYPEGSAFTVPKNGWQSGGIAPPANPDSYGITWRVFDAQYAGVPQRRRRVFVVGYLGDWRPAAAVLFERHSLSRHSPPRREARERVARTVAASSPSGGGYRNDADTADNLTVVDVCPTLRDGNSTGGDRPPGTDVDTCESLIQVAFGGNNTSGPIDVSTAVSAHGGPSGRLDFESETFVAAYRTSPNHGAWETGDRTDALTTGSDQTSHIVAFGIRSDASRPGEALTPSADADGRMRLRAPGMGGGDLICFSAKDHGADAMSDLSPTLRAGGHIGSHANAGVMPAVAFDLRGREGGAQFEGPHDTANVRAASGGSSRSYVAASAVRRLTPRECERLQGCADDYTRIPIKTLKSRPKSKHFDKYPDLYDENPDGTWTRFMADGPRYKMLGNSQCVNDVKWICGRIQMVDDLLCK